MNRLSGVLLRIGEATASFFDRREALVVTMALAAFTGLSIWDSALYPFWFDEFFSFNIAHLPTLQDAFHAMPADGQPPLHYAFIRLITWAFGNSEISTRLYSTLAYAIAALAIYLIIRRRARAVYAFFGMMMALDARIALAGISPTMVNLARSARPYSLLLCFTTLTFLAWQRAKDKQNSRTPELFAMAAAIAGAVCTHFYGALHVGAPLAVGEAIRLMRRKRADWLMYAFIAGGFLFLLPVLPIARQSSRVMGHYVKESTVFWARPSLRSQSLDYQELLPSMAAAQGFFVFAFVLCLAVPGRREDTAAEVPREEWYAAIALALLLPLEVFLTKHTTHYFLIRYAVGSLAGVALVASLFLFSIGRGRRIVAPLTACSALWMAMLLVLQVLMLIHRDRNRPVAVPNLLAHNNSDLPIVVDSALDYASIWWYSPDGLKSRLDYLSDEAFAVKQSDFLPELSLTLNQRYMPMKVTPYRDFLAGHRRFLVFSSGNPQLEWTRDRLRSEGWRSTVAGKEGGMYLYLLEAPGP